MSNAPVKYNINKTDGGGFTEISKADVPVYAMPTGPGGGKRKTRQTRRKGTRTFPHGILKQPIVPSKNPTRSPPTRKTVVRILSDKQVEETRKTMKAKALKTKVPEIRKKLIGKGLISPHKKVDSQTLRMLYSEAVGAGLIN